MARIDLGLAESEFWELTPRQYRALIDRQRENRERAEQRADMRAGVIAAAMFNAQGGIKGKAVKADTFFRLEPIGKTEPVQPRQWSKGRQAIIESQWMAWAGAQGVRAPAGLVTGGSRG